MKTAGDMEWEMAGSLVTKRHINSYSKKRKHGSECRTLCLVTLNDNLRFMWFSSYLGGFSKPFLTINSIADIPAEKIFVVVFLSPHHCDFVVISAVNVIVDTSAWK